MKQTLLPFCKAHNIGVICYSPMYKGLLTGKFTVERVAGLPADDHRKNDKHFQEPELSINLELIAKLKDIAESSDHTLAQLALAWALRREEVTAVIAGGRQPEQVEELIPAGDWQLSPATIDKIDKLLKTREEQLAACFS